MRFCLATAFPLILHRRVPVAIQRWFMEMVTGWGGAVPDNVSVSPLELAGIPAVEYKSNVCDEAAVVVFYLHGGAFITGSSRADRIIAGYLAEFVQGRVVSVDYRLAPEHPGPAALQDAVRAWEVLLEQGTDASRTVFVGNSAGGNLVLQTAMQCRSQGIERPAAIVAISPWTDLTNAKLHQPDAGDPILREEWLELAKETYCNAECRATMPEVSPIFRALEGLPPLLIQVGQDGILLNDSLRFAERADAAGVDVTLEEFKHCWHVFHLQAGVLVQARQAVERCGEFICSHVAAGTSVSPPS